MPRRIQAESWQTKPLSLEAEAYLNLQRTAEHLMEGLASVLKSAELSPTQFNVLRILRGAGREGLACWEIGERMVTRDPDVTRLLDRLEARGLIARSRESKDRRVITVRITEAGLAALDGLDRRVEEAHREQFAGLGARRLRGMIATLEMVRRGK
jgi:DNA-binding MarR family transcriptional regulator